MPVYQSRISQQMYGEYNPHALAPELCRDVPTDCRSWLLIGGRRDLAAGIAVNAGLSAEAAAEVRVAVFHRAVLLARVENLFAIGLYLRDEDAAALGALLGGDAITPVGRTATLNTSGSEAGYLASLSSRRRNRIRRDWRRLEESGLRAAEAVPDEVLASAAPLVAANKQRYGISDHPALAAMRLRDWAASGAGRCVAFTVRDRAGQLLAVEFCCDDGRMIESYELGLRAGQPCRRDLYLEVVFYAPLRYAWRHGGATIELGSGSLVPKQLRGAITAALWMGVDHHRAKSGEREAG